MTCPSQDAVDVAGPMQLEALALLMSNQAQPCGHAPSIMPPPHNGAQSDMIASRCRRMQFRSNEARKRYLAVHAILSRGA